MAVAVAAPGEQIVIVMKKKIYRKMRKKKKRGVYSDDVLIEFSRLPGLQIISKGHYSC